MLRIFPAPWDLISSFFHRQLQLSVPYSDFISKYLYVCLYPGLFFILWFHDQRSVLFCILAAVLKFWSRPDVQYFVSPSLPRSSWVLAWTDAVFPHKNVGFPIQLWRLTVDLQSHSKIPLFLHGLLTRGLTAFVIIMVHTFHPFTCRTNTSSTLSCSINYLTL